MNERRLDGIEKQQGMEVLDVYLSLSVYVKD
jgi:hypothetical protein